MFKTLSNAWRIKEIRSKMIFTILMIVVYRLGNTIPIPFMDKKVVSNLMSTNAGGLVNLLDLLSRKIYFNFIFKYFLFKNLLYLIFIFFI